MKNRIATNRETFVIFNIFHKSGRPRRDFGRIGLLFALLPLLALTGCHQDDKTVLDSGEDLEMENIHVRQTHFDDSVKTSKDVTTGQPMQAIVETGQAPLLSNIVPGSDRPIDTPGISATGHSSSSGPRIRGADSDYVDKADIYWKLNWLRKHINDQTLPADFEKAIKIARETLAATKQDPNYTLGDDALSKFESGLKHYKAMQLLKNGHINLSMIPWGGGVETVQHSLDRGVLGFGEKIETHSVITKDDDDSPILRRADSSSLASLSPQQQKIVDIVLEYARLYQASPEAMRHRDWNIALQKTNRLRDELGLMNRAENRENTYEEIESGSTGSLSGTDGVVPIPSTGDAMPKSATGK